MSDSDLTPSIADTLYDHRLAKNTTAERDCNFFCTCFEWSTKTANTSGHAHQEWIHHIASVLSGVYAITPLPDVERAVQLYHEVTPNADTSGWATHHGSYDTVYSSVGEHTWTRAECDLDADAELIAAAVNLVASIARAQETPQ